MSKIAITVLVLLALASVDQSLAAPRPWSFPKLDAKKEITTKEAEFPEGERLLYDKILKAYRKDKLKKVSQSTELMMKWYPQSIYIDNAVYLMAELALKNGHFAEAIRGFDFVIKRYPLGNKRASALFAKAVAYRRLNLAKQAKRTLYILIKTYPGSPESFRAASELRLLQAKKG